jgi:DNA invertase Pin-like site-specific DNA recombinase
VREAATTTNRPVRRSANLRAAVYVRISKDDQGDELGVARQEKLCRRLAASKHWTVADVYQDNDVSASSGVERPAYERLLADIEAGAVDAVVVFDLDRLHRRPAELEHFIDLADEHSIALATVGGDVNLANPDDRFKARLMGVVAKGEAEKMSKRLKAMHAEKAEQGLPVGAGTSTKRRPFGYQVGGMKIDETEAELIRQAAADVLAGVPLSAIARRWSQQGVRVPSGTARGWSPNSVKYILTGARAAGLRSHAVTLRRENGRAIYGPATLYPAAWPAILDRATHDRLVEHFAQPVPMSVPRRRTLLTSLVHCGMCGATMGRVYRHGNPYLQCMHGVGRTGCGRVAMRADAVEVAVLDRVLAHIDERAALGVEALLTTDATGEAREVAHELTQAERFKLQLAERIAAGADFDDAELSVMRRTNRERIETLKARLADLTATSVMSRWDSVEAFESEWEAADLDTRWGLLRSIVESVTVAAKTGKLLDPARISVRFRT